LALDAGKETAAHGTDGLRSSKPAAGSKEVRENPSSGLRIFFFSVNFRMQEESFLDKNGKKWYCEKGRALLTLRGFIEVRRMKRLGYY
jgi:hypothetical protein